MGCQGIFQGASFDCENPLVAGVDEELILINLADIESVTYDTETPTIISDITLINGASAYAFQGTRQSLVPQSNFIPGRFSVGYDHQTAFQVFDITQRSKDNLEAMAIRKTVGVVHNSDGSFEVYGIRQGLEVLTNDRLPADQDTGGSFSMVLKTSDNTAREPKLPQTWLDTDEATTQAKVEALLNQPRVDNVEPTAVSIAGGDSMTVLGANFQIGSPLADHVTQFDFVDNLGAVTNQATFTIVDENTITCTTVALSAGTYKVRLTAANGSIGDSALVVIAS